MYYFSADTEVLEKKLQSYHRIGKFSLSELVKTLRSDSVGEVKDYRPTVIAFELNQKNLEILPRIIEHAQGYLFRKIWEKKGEELHKSSEKLLPMNDVIPKVWIPVLKQWTHLCKQLISGDILFSEVEKWFKGISSNEADLKKEFSLIQSLIEDSPTDWIEERLSQIVKHRKLKECLYGAGAIVDVVETYNMEGDFSQIQDIFKMIMKIFSLLIFVPVFQTTTTSKNMLKEYV